MAQINGRLTICDHCGKVVFSKHTGQEQDWDGLSTWDKFEELPKGWDCIQVDFIKYWLCPPCYEELRAYLKKFITSPPEEATT